MNLVLLLAVLLFGFTQGQKRCRTIGTPTRPSLPCIFPFKFNGKTYNTCITDLDPDNKLWCSVKVDSKGFHLRGKWGHCEQSCTTQRLEPIISQRPLPFRTINDPIKDCVAVSGDRCVFPFILKGRVYNTCTNVTDPDGRDWCSIQVDRRGNHIQGRWSHCECSTKSGCKSDTYGELSKQNADGRLLPGPEDPDFQCGVSRLQDQNNEFIFGGNKTKLQEFPFAVLLVYSVKGKKSFLCGGSLINRRYVLTAAHCMTGREPDQVRLGDYDISKDCDCLTEKGVFKCAPTPQTIDIEQIIVHPGYAPSQRHANDIALIRLKKLAKLNLGTGVVCLPLPETGLDNFKGRTNLLGTDLAGEEAVVVGWGQDELFSRGDLDSSGAHSSVIQSVTINIVDDETCKEEWGGRGPTSGQICAGNVGKDSCRGDSGGPLLRKPGAVSNTWYLLGIVSFGHARCGNGKPAVYTRVAHYIDWIKENLEP